MSAKRKTTKEPLPVIDTVDADTGDAVEERPKRLCSEIQLFDLCSKNSCDAKDGRFCTDEKMLSRFEAISDEEDAVPDRYDAGEFEEDGEEDFSSYGEDEDGAGEDEEDYDDEP